MNTQRDKTEKTLAESVEFLIRNLSGDVVTLREIGRASCRERV